MIGLGVSRFKALSQPELDKLIREGKGDFMLTGKGWVVVGQSQNEYETEEAALDAAKSNTNSSKSNTYVAKLVIKVAPKADVDIIRTDNDK